MNGYDQHSLRFMSEHGLPKRLPESVLVKPRPLRETVSSGDMPEAALNAQRRNKLPDSDFALPKERRYPIDTPARARAALARAKVNDPSKLTQIKRAVKRRYPEMDVESAK